MSPPSSNGQYLQAGGHGLFRQPQDPPTDQRVGSADAVGENGPLIQLIHHHPFINNQTFVPAYALDSEFKPAYNPFLISLSSLLLICSL
jgi:hypothetical protein